MNFNLYLLKNNFLSKSQFVDICLYQIKNTSSFIEFLLENNYVDKEQLADLLEAQFKTSRSILQIIVDKNIFESQKLKEIRLAFDKSAPSTYKIVSSKKYLESSVLLDAFSGYLEESKGNVEYSLIEGSQALEKPDAEEEASNGEGVFDAAIESLKELGMSDEEIREQLGTQEKGSEEVISNNDASIEEINQNKEIISEADDQADISDVALESLRELAGGDTDLLNQVQELESQSNEIDSCLDSDTVDLGLDIDLMSTFSKNLSGEKIDETRADVGKLKSKLESDNFISKNLLGTIYESVHSFLGATKIIKSSYFKEISEDLDLIFFEIVENKKMKFTKKQWFQLIDLTHEYLDLADSFAKTITNDRKENGLFKNNEIKTKYASYKIEIVKFQELVA